VNWIGIGMYHLKWEEWS